MLFIYFLKYQKHFLKESKVNLPFKDSSYNLKLYDLACFLFFVNGANPSISKKSVKLLPTNYSW